jgi:uncharacterized protein (TIGR02284 family)
MAAPYLRRTFAKEKTMAPIQKLQDLIHLDMDAIMAYDQAIRACEHETVAEQLRQFRADHGRHVRDLSEELRKLGETPDVRTDAKGFFIEKFTAITARGTRTALIAMLANENITTAKYSAAVELEDIPESAKAVIRQNYSDEQRHQDWIRNAIDQKIWEQPQPSASAPSPR